MGNGRPFPEVKNLRHEVTSIKGHGYQRVEPVTPLLSHAVTAHTGTTLRFFNVTIIMKGINTHSEQSYGCQRQIL